MPHIAPKTRAARSPFDVVAALEVIAGAGINLLGVGGGNLEIDGLLSVMVSHDDDVDRIIRLWQDAGYTDAKAYGEPEGEHLDYTDDESGGLVRTLVRARRHHPDRAVRDITVGVMPITFWIDAGEIVRDDDGYPMEDDSRGGVKLERLPVQVFFDDQPPRDPNQPES